MKKRDTMTQFARTGVYNFVEENLSESEFDSDVYSFLRRSEEENRGSEADSKEKIAVVIGPLDEDEDQIELEKSMIWEPEKRFTIILPHSENRFKSFRK